MSAVVIGIDPHKHLNAVVAVSAKGNDLARRTIDNTNNGFNELRSIGRQWRERTWAIEGCNGVGTSPSDVWLRRSPEPRETISPSSSVRSRATSNGLARRTGSFIRGAARQRRTTMDRVRIPQLLLGAAAAVLFVASVVGFVGRDSDRHSETSPTAAGSVTIVDFTFDPSELTATVGETITWTNEDSAPHTVTSESDGPLDSGDINGGATYEATFDEPGSYPYVCTIHPTMQGTVEVTS